MYHTSDNSGNSKAWSLFDRQLKVRISNLDVRYFLGGSVEAKLLRGFFIMACLISGPIAYTYGVVVCK